MFVDLSAFPDLAYRMMPVYHYAGVWPESGQSTDIFVTHAHSDHWGSLPEYTDLGNAKVHITKEAYDTTKEFSPQAPLKFRKSGEMLQRLPLAKYRYAGRWGIARVGNSDFESLQPFPEVRSYLDTGDPIDIKPLTINGVKVELFKLLGHSMSDLMVHFPDLGILAVGDLLMLGTTPICWSGKVESLLTSLNLIKQMHPGIIVPGHGPIADLGSVGRAIAYWEFFMESVDGLHQMGLSPAEITRSLISRSDFVRNGYHLMDPERNYLNVAMRCMALDGISSLKELSKAQKSPALWIELASFARYFPEATPKALHQPI